MQGVHDTVKKQQYEAPREPKELRADIEEEDDEESFFKFHQEKQKKELEMVAEVEYDSDDNPIIKGLTSLCSLALSLSLLHSFLVYSLPL